MPEPELKVDNIQGNILAGFNKDHQSFLFVNFPAGNDAYTPVERWALPP